MIGNPQIATLYVWERNNPFDMDYLLFVLGGAQPPTTGELQIHWRRFIREPMHCTEDFKIYYD